MTDLDVVLYLEVDKDELVHCLTGRRMDSEMGDIYHFEYNPPEDPKAEERLVQRDDDTEETVRERPSVFHENTEYYKEQGNLEPVDGGQVPARRGLGRSAGYN